MLSAIVLGAILVISGITVMKSAALIKNAYVVGRPKYDSHYFLLALMSLLVNCINLLTMCSWTGSNMAYHATSFTLLLHIVSMFFFAFFYAMWILRNTVYRRSSLEKLMMIFINVAFIVFFVMTPSLLSGKICFYPPKSYETLSDAVVDVLSMGSFPGFRLLLLPSEVLLVCLMAITLCRTVPFSENGLHSQKAVCFLSLMVVEILATSGCAYQKCVMIALFVMEGLFLVSFGKKDIAAFGLPKLVLRRPSKE